MIRKIQNEHLEVLINDLGAELYSIKSKKTGAEYLWQGDKKYWQDRSPNLFPICGRLFGGKYYYKGAEYKMDIHGFSRVSTFSQNKTGEQEIEFTLKSTEQTKKCYPFDFVFKVKYSLTDTTLKTQYVIENIGDKDLYFSFGAHPGFNVPFNDSGNFEDYYLEFSDTALEKLMFSKTCFNTGKTEFFALEDKKLFLKHSLFDNDAIFVKSKNDNVKLKSNKSINSIEISYSDMTCLGLWHMPKTDAPYVCIEPWHGLPSTDGVVDNLETKLDMIVLAKNKIYENFYTIKISE